RRRTGPCLVSNVGLGELVAGRPRCRGGHRSGRSSVLLLTAEVAERPVWRAVLGPRRALGAVAGFALAQHRGLAFLDRLTGPGAAAWAVVAAWVLVWGAVRSGSATKTCC